MKTKRLFISLTLGLGLTLALLWLLSGQSEVVLAQAGSGVIRVAPPPAGNDVPNCGGETNPCRTVQYAVDQAQAGEEIRVASGVYTGVQNVPSLNTGTFTATQVVVITKTLTLRGGYTTTNWTTPYPIAQPTTLDAQGQGRVLFITGDISPTVEGLRITGGDAGGLGGAPWGDDAGGGVYVVTATATLSNNWVFSNIADYGSGLYLNSSDATLSGNTVTSNTVSEGGGGLYLGGGAATLSGNTVSGNTADSDGGGLYLAASAATLSGNTVSGNTADSGGGLYLAASDATLDSNTVSGNTADYGGGLYLNSSDATLSGDTVSGNTASLQGGGLYLTASDATLSSNTVLSNTASFWGGGLFLEDSAATLSGNTVMSNTASFWGGGLYLDNSEATFSSNTVTSNTASLRGGGLYLLSSDAMLSGNTILSNTADSGGGLYLTASDATLNSNTVSGNTADSDGGGSYLAASDATLNSNTVSGNTADSDGGGLYLEDSAATLSGNDVISNTASFQGGGLYLSGSAATLSDNTVTSNTAYSEGGGLYLDSSDATLSDNTVTSNTSTGWGGGLHLSFSNAATLIGNDVISNTASSLGGGLSLFASDATLSGNTVLSNTANSGGGLYLDASDAMLSDNTVISNIADSGVGGGLYLDASDAMLNGNTVSGNTANTAGGGLYLAYSTATLSSNTIQANTTITGGGLYLTYSAVTLTNNVVTNNQANNASGGLYIRASSPRLLHTTIARNSGGDGSGIYVTNYGSNYSTVALTNTILVSHTVGISLTAGNTVTVNSILWYDTPITVSQATTANVTVWNQYQGDPAFTADGYHLTAGSAAIDQGVEAGVTVDIDGESRPAGTGYDLGADEFPAALRVTKEADQMVVSGSDVTFTLTITNTGYMDLSNVTVTDVEAPGCAKTVGDLDVGISTTYTCTGPSVTADFTNTATATGMSPAGTVTDTDTAFVDVISPTIDMAKAPDMQMVVSGSDVTFTLTITNTGDVTLTTVTVSDTVATNCAQEIGDLAAGISTTYTCTRPSVTADFTNTATVTGTPPVGPDVTDTDMALVNVISPTIKMAKAPQSQPVQSGDAVTFTITVTNTGDVPLTPVTVTDALAPDCERTFVSLGVGARESYTCTRLNVTADFTNTATVTGTPPVGAVVTDTETAFVYIISPTIDVDKAPESQPVQSGDTVTFTITVTNTGDVPLTPVTVTDDLVPNCERTFVSLGVEATESYTCTRLNVTADFTNTATVTGTPPVGAVVTDTETALVYIINPAIEIAKAPDSQIVQSGDVVAFTITVTNTGDVSLAPVTVTDALAPNCERTFVNLGVGARESYTCTRLNVTADFTNTATVTGTPPVGNVVTDTATALVDVINPDIEIAKTPDIQTVVSGSTVVFTITVVNTGDADLSDVTVTDVQAPNCAQTIGGLGVGISTTYICTRPSVTADFTNTAVVTGTPPVGTVTDTDTATVLVEEAIEGLRATNDSPTQLDSVTTLTATITGGSNVVFTWAFGHDGATGSGAVVDHIYPDVGVYTAIVTASNSVSVLTATTPVTITDALIEGLIANNDSPTVLGQATELTATITGGSNVVYTWALGDGDTGSGAVVVHTYPATGTYTAVVTASNSVSVLTATTPVTIIEALELYLPIILKDYTPPPEPPTATPTSTSPLPTATPTSTSPPPTATPTSTSPPPTGPDLVVTDMSVVPNPPEAGQSATVYVTVKNQGNQAVPYGNNFYVDFYVDREPAPLIRGDIDWGVQGSWFGAGESRTLSDSYTFTEGTHQLWAQVDTDNTVVETDENNNVLGPVTLDATSLGGGEAPTRPVIIPTPGAGSPRPTPTPAP